MAFSLCCILYGERNWYFYFNYVIYLQGNNIFIYVVFTVKGNF